MSAPESEWPRGRWLVNWLVAFGIMVGFIMLVSRPAPAPTKDAEGRVRLWLDRPLDEAWMEQLGVADPALFALPNARGFSGGWMEQSNLTHRLSRWVPPERWLAPNSNDWGAPLGMLLSSNRPSLFLAGRQATPDLRLPVPPPILVETNSLLEFGAALTNRLAATASPVRLPEWYAPDVLRPSVVQVMVNPAGLVLTARLLERSGWPRADRHALALARKMRFAAIDAQITNLLVATNFITDDLTFRWATRAEAVSNITPARLP